MLTDAMMQEILDLKAAGYSISEIARHFDGQSGKSPSLPTIRKYYRMDAVPEDARSALAKDKAFDTEPLRSAIIKILEANPQGCHISSVYDVLEERFVEAGELEYLPGNQQTLRNYVRFLKESGAVSLNDQPGRIYDHVFDTPPGQQLLIDFGQQHIAKGLDVHFICLLLRYSRKLGVYAQDHNFNGIEACRAIQCFFAKCSGRPSEVVIDQDAVFVATETYGEVIETEVFGDFLREQDLRLWVCNKSDPQSKGPIENTVGFVKKNFFSARNITCIEDVLRSLPGWVERKNKRIHQTTYKIPEEVFSQIEKPALRSLLPSVYENAPLNLVRVKIGSMPYIQYKSSKYSTPRDMCFSEAYIKAIGEKLHIYDKDRKHICTHVINPCKGSYNQLEEHQKEPSTEWMQIAERLRQKYNCFSFQHFINGFKKENARHLAQQLEAVEAFLDSEKPDRLLVSEVMDACCKNYRYRFSQFKTVFELVRTERLTPRQIEISDVQKAELSAYQQAFEKRCVV